MTNADKFLIAVQTGLLASDKLQKGISDYAERMLDAIRLTEAYEDNFKDMGQAALKADVNDFLKYALLGTQHEWIVSKLK